MSHDFENEWDFLNKIGTIGSDGKMVRRIAKNIFNYHESSLVWLGADPFAKAIDTEGNLKHIDISSVYSYAKTSFSKGNKIDLDTIEAIPENVENSRKWKVNFAVDKNVLSLAQRKNTVTKNNKNMNKFWLAFVTVFGDKLNLTADSQVPADDKMQELLQKLSFVAPEDAQKATEAMAALSAVTTPALEAFRAIEGNAEATTVDMGEFMKNHSFVNKDALVGFGKLQEDKEALELKVTSLVADATIGKQYLGMKRAEAIRLYKKTVGEDKADASVIAIFEKADNDAVEGLLKQYTKTATHKFSGKCGDCGSLEFEFRSSFSGKEDPSTVEIPMAKTVSAQAIYEETVQSSMQIGRTKE